jgi:uncharacterized protein (DUF433 family)
MQKIKEIVGGEPYVYTPLGEYVVKAQGVCGGRPTFYRTRIPVSSAINRVKAGQCIDTIVTTFRNKVPKEAIQEAIRLFMESNRNKK